MTAKITAIEVLKDLIITVNDTLSEKQTYVAVGETTNLSVLQTDGFSILSSTGNLEEYVSILWNITGDNYSYEKKITSYLNYYIL